MFISLSYPLPGLRRPAGWAQTLKYRVTIKEDVCRLNNISEAEIKQSRTDLEAEVYYVATG
jgi:hypothetical protein